MTRSHKIAELVPYPGEQTPDDCVGCPTRRSKLVWENPADGRCGYCGKAYCKKCFETHAICCEKAPRVKEKKDNG